MKDSIILGIALGAIFPLLAYFISDFTDIGTTYFSQKPIGIYVLAAVANLVAVRFIYRSGREATAKGIVLITFIAMVAMVFLFRIKV